MSFCSSIFQHFLTFLLQAVVEVGAGAEAGAKPLEGVSHSFSEWKVQKNF